MKYILTSWLVLLFSIAGFAQTWDELSEQALGFYKNGNFKQAISLGEKMVEAANKEFGSEHKNYIFSQEFLGFLYEGDNQYKKAEPLYLQVKEFRKKKLGENHPDYETSLANLSRVYSGMGDYGKAEPYYIQIKEYRERTVGKTHANYATSLNNLALLYSNMGQYNKAETYYLDCIEIDKINLGESNPEYAIGIANLASLYVQIGDYEKAELFFVKAKDIIYNTLGENQESYWTILNNLGLLYNKIGMFEKAEASYLRVIESRKRVHGEHHLGYALSLANLADLYKEIGQLSKAELFSLQAMDIRKKVLGDNHPDYALNLNSLGVLYFSMGLFEKAETFYKKSIEIRKKILGENHPEYGVSLNNLAVLYNNMGQFSKAETLYLAALKITKNTVGENHPEYALNLDNLAALYHSFKEYEKAAELMAKAIEIKKNSLGENHLDYLTSLNNLGSAYHSMGQFKKAELYYTEAKDGRKGILGEHHLDYAASLDNLGLLYNEMGQPSKAENFFLQNSQIVIDNITSAFTILSEKEKGSYLANKVSLNNQHNSFLYNYRAASPTFYYHNYNLQLLLKSLSLADTKSTLQTIRNSTDTSVKRLLEEWQKNKILLSKQYSLPVEKRKGDIKEMEARTESFEKLLSRKSSEFRNQQNATKISLENIQKNLQYDEIAIEFVNFKLYNNRWTDTIIYAAYILRNNDSVPVFVPLCEEKQLQKLFDSAGTTATTMVNSFYRGLKVENKNATTFGKELYQLVWQPLEPYLKNVKKISYSPAGKLYSIAFHALPVDSNSILMDKYQLQQYTSTRQVVLREQEKQNSKPQNIVLFGDATFDLDSLQIVKGKTESTSTNIYSPVKKGTKGDVWNNLPGTAKEVKTIQSLFEKNQMTTKIFTQIAASEENLKALNGNSPQILHIATHGFFLPEPDKKKMESGFDEGNTYTLADDPLLRTGLILSGGNYAWSGKAPIDGVEDGIATAYEISQLNLSNTELVVLSACETALGDVKGSEGVFGLQRAFKMAGVKKMIVSLWQVPDKETAELMTAFYTYWMKGKTINDAFAQAQADMRKKYSPFYWAAFLLVE